MVFKTGGVSSMIDLRYCILERTPFPGYWQPVHSAFLKEAEYALWHAVMSHYHDRAIIVSERWPKRVLVQRLYAYRWHDASALADYLRSPEFSLNAGGEAIGEYQLWGYVVG